LSKKTWAVVLVFVAVALLLVVGLVLLGLAMSGRMGPGMMSARPGLLQRGLRGQGELLGGQCPLFRGVAASAPRCLVGLLVLSLLCGVPLALVVVLVVLARWAARPKAPPATPSV